jgi:hypothetical protein
MDEPDLMPQYPMNSVFATAEDFDLSRVWWEREGVDIFGEWR